MTDNNHDTPDHNDNNIEEEDTGLLLKERTQTKKPAIAEFLVNHIT